MRCPKWISAQDLDRWAETQHARQLLPELLRRLVFGTVSPDHLKKINFPSGAEVQRPGYDGTTVVSKGTAFVPAGVCFWELGCEANPKTKAQEDYDKRIQQHQERLARGETENLGEATYIAVTALDWQGAEEWAQKRNGDGNFKAVLAYDSNGLEHWVQQAPAVGLWLAQKIHGRRDGVVDLAAHWANVQATLRRPLPAKILLVNREGIGAAFTDWFVQSSGELAVKAPSPAELLAVFCAWVQTLPIDQQDAISSRAIIVEERETWRALASSQQPLILISSPRLQSDAELFAEAVRQGHHVLRFAEFRTPRSAAATELATMHRFDLQRALAEAGFPEQEAHQLAEAAGGTFTILRRRLASTAIEAPGWSQDGGLAPLLLAAAWEDGREADQCVVSKLADKKYSEVQALMTKWRQSPDPPVRLVLGSWEFLSPVDAWDALHPLLTATHMDCFEQVAVEVLTEDNPALDLPPEDRIMASVKGKVPRFSAALRRGTAEILALGATREEESGIGTELHFALRAASVVRRVLPGNCAWRRWASLGELLPLLMEAAPDAVLEAIERDLYSLNPQLVELLRQEIPGGIFGAAYQSGVLWALETAAWPKENFQRVALALTRLAKLDPGGKWANRPLSSLTRIFFSWRPQSLATVRERIDALRFLFRKEPQVTWKMLLALLPQLHESIADNVKPSYRSWAAGWTGEVPMADYMLFLSELTDMVLAVAESDQTRWPELLEHIFCLQETDFAKVIDGLERLTSQSIAEELRLALWEQLREQVQAHSYFHDARWARSKAEVAKLASLRDKLAPTDLATTAAYLFDDDGGRDGDRTETYEQKRERRANERRPAIRAIWNTQGVSAVLELARKVRQPWSVGWSLAQELGAEAQPVVVPGLLSSEEMPVLQCARAFALQRIQAKGLDWAEAEPAADWKFEQVAEWALQMPFQKRTWNWLIPKGEAAERNYWKKTTLWDIAQLDIEAIERAAQKLQEVGRPWSALQLLVRALLDKKPLRSALLCDALEASSKTSTEGRPGTIDVYDVQEAFAFLQKSPDADEGRVARLEFAFLPLLDGLPQLPLTLQRQLARDPQFFVDCLSVLYRPKHSDREVKEVNDPDKAERATRIWHLLHDWQTIPGTGVDGVVSAGDLRYWVQSARLKARESDRLGVCDLTLGELFARSPEDADEAKPLVAIRDVIEECESAEMERGFYVGLHNLRGCVTKDLYEGGPQERDLAAMYERYAQICSRWHRTAVVLRNLSQDYFRQADFEDERARARD